MASPILGNNGQAFNGQLLMGQESRTLNWGMAAFVTTALTCLVPVTLKHVDFGVVTPATAPGGSVEVEALPLGSISGTVVQEFVCAKAGTVSFVFDTHTAIAADNANNWTFAIVNKTQAGASVVATTGITNNTTIATGTAIAADTPVVLTLTANTIVAAGDVLEITITKVSAATTMAECVLNVSVATAGGSEPLYLTGTTAGLIAVATDGTVTVSRKGVNPVSASKFFFAFLGW